MSNKEIILKELKKGKSFLCLGIFLIVISFIMFIGFYFEGQEKLNNLYDLKDVRVSDVYAKIDAQVMTDYFATNDYNGIEHKTYFIWDEENIYIVDLNEKTRVALEPIYNYSYSNDENIEKPNSILIKGMTKKIPEDLKKIAIDSLNTFIGREVVNSTNFNQTFGIVYLDTFVTPIIAIRSDMLFCLPILIIGLFLVGFYFNKRRKTKKCIHQLGSVWEEVQREIENDDTIYYKSFKLYFTRNYIVCTLNGLEVYPYKEIIWLYSSTHTTTNFSTLKSIFIKTKDKKTHKLLSLYIVRKSKNMFDEIYDAILKHTPNALEGYTSENKEKVQEM